MQLIKNKFRKIPVCINNYYGDPLLQWENTLKKLEQLQREEHVGPVSIITRGYLDKDKANRLKEAVEGLNFLLIVSVSELPYHIEPLSHKERYLTIQNALESGIVTLPNIRPIFPSLNGKREVLEKIYKEISSVGVEVVVASGFRGDEEMVQNMNVEEKLDWNLRVKLLTQDIAKTIEDMSQKYSVYTAKRVSCGVAIALNTGVSHNPYYFSPLLAGCDSCPIKDTCAVIGRNRHLSEEEENFLKRIGYDITVKREVPQLCSTTPANRMECPSCCTACYVCEGTKIFINNDITLGDTAFIRFLTGVIGTQIGIHDKGGKTARANVVSDFIGEDVHFVNSWMVWSRQMSKCFGCSYCITQAYTIEENDFGMTPLMLWSKIENSMNGVGD